MDHGVTYGVLWVSRMGCYGCHLGGIMGVTYGVLWVSLMGCVSVQEVELRLVLLVAVFVFVDHHIKHGFHIISLMMVSLIEASS